ncbi:NrsF family protein [Ancylobacter sp. IITR112]|uniref:NrsF family protein n=1 Tax=Ancylobacter sp. IITR112 TaxID=3138073 RepID=UPI00352A2F2D
MKTDDLIRALAADTRRSAPPLGTVRRAALVLAVLLAGAVFSLSLGPRPDALAALETVRFLFKFVVTLALAASAFVLLGRLVRPGEAARAPLGWLLAGPLLLVIGVGLELLAVPAAEWSTRLVGVNARTCLTFIPLIGAAPLVVFLAVLRHGAPTRPVLAGAVAGLLAGGLAAAFYAAHCPDDSPLFVASWYSLAIAGLAAAGALIGPRVARW